MAKKKEGTLMEALAPTEEAPTEIGVRLVALDLIDDNPFQPRQHYSTTAIEGLALSIKQHGMLQIPIARPHPDDPQRVQLGFGHLRKRAYVKLSKKYGQRYAFMRLSVREASDKEMALWSLEENIKRKDITTIDIARAVDVYMVTFEDATEKDLAAQLNMTQPNISNMRRVLRLPEKILEKIDAEVINFTMGRELLAFENVQETNQGYRTVSSSKVMLDAVSRLNKPGGTMYGEPATVPGIQRAMYRVAQAWLGPLEKSHASYQREPLFDTRGAAGCLKCEFMVRAHPTKSEVAHFCGNLPCWDTKQQEHRDKMAEEARAQMQADIISKVVADEQERQRIAEEAEVEAADAKAEGVEPATPEQQLAEDISQEISPAEAALSDEDRAELEDAVSKHLAEQNEQTQRIRSAKDLPSHYPCHRCANVAICQRTTVHDEGGKMVCENQQNPETAPAIDTAAQVDIPEHMKALIAEKAGTRAQILDLKDLRLGSWGELQRGYCDITQDLSRMYNPDECTQRCTTGFHFAYDSSHDAKHVSYVCTNTKCVTKKKSAFTRACNAAGMGRKKAEAAAIKQAVTDTTEVLDLSRLVLIVNALCCGRSISRYGGDNTRIWWGSKMGVEVDSYSNHMPGPFWPLVEALEASVLAKYIVECCLWSLQYSGNNESYRILTTRALNRMGIGVTVPKEFEEAAPAAPGGGDLDT